MTEPVRFRPKVFISYSHKDEAWKDKLLDHLSVIAREEDFDVWQDRKIEGGSEWYKEITRQIDEASIAILLVSVDFLKSEFIRNEEVRRFLDRRREVGLRIYPLIIHECPWRRIRWLSQLQVRPLDGQALSQWEGHRLNQELTVITDEIAQILEAAPPLVRLTRKEQFLATFRHRLAPEYSRWDLGTVGVTQSGGASRPIETDLNVMYLPLRLAEGFDIAKTDRGQVLPPERLIRRKEPLVIRGPAGAGKTTWMRWTFRQLLRMESALPLMLVLRDLAARWQDRSCRGADRALDAFLESWIAEYIGSGWEGVLSELLSAEVGPRPLLLVDGWDEIGPLGDELRSKLLGFLGQYPRVLTIVTSRPYGEGRPSHAEGFEILDIQPLADREIADFASRFFTYCHGEEKKDVQKNSDHFLRAIERSSEAQSLARTTLLLTMMLLISRSRPLPDKRHLLYDACIENLLTALPNRKEQEGALLGREQWRPDDSEERMRVVAAMAAELQEAGYARNFRSSVVRSWDEMTILLPATWPEARKTGFLAWLAGPAGLLADRADGTLSFTHLSFQEYLTAWRLNAEIEGTAARTETFRQFLRDPDWWETLRLWAALIEKQSRERLDQVLLYLIDRADGLCLAGAILADGLGADERFYYWLDMFSSSLGQVWLSSCDICAQAWSASRQEKRRAELAHRLDDQAKSQGWLCWLRIDEFSRQSSLPVEASTRPGTISQFLFDQLRGHDCSEPASVAVGRILSGGPSIWPLNPLYLGLLQVWPTYRCVVGMRLQAAQATGASRTEITLLSRHFLKRPTWKRAEKLKATSWANNWDPSAHSSSARALAHDLARYSVQNWFFDWRHDYWTRDWAVDWNRDYALFKANDWLRDWACGFDPSGTYKEQEQISSLASLIGIDLQKSLWFRDFAIGEELSWGRAATRVCLAYALPLEQRVPEFDLLAKASALSLHLNFEPSLEELIMTLDTIDPLWPALARHLARRSTHQDRALLIDLAQYPEKRDPPLSWGLQYIVRGDVMLDDGSVVTLDQLADEVGLPHLSYLEDMPVEFEVSAPAPASNE